MKNKLLFGILLSASIVLLNSCEKDPEKIFEEEEIQGDVRDRFIGEWTVTETSKLLSTRNYKVKIEKNSYSNQRVSMHNFYLLGTAGDTLVANISAVLASAITIPTQTINSNSIGGEGEYINENKITFKYTVDDGNDIDTVSAVYIR